MKKQSTAKGVAVLTAAAIIVKVISLLYVPILLKILGDYGIAIYYAAYTIFSWIYSVATTGVPQAISKTVSELIAVGNYKDAAKAFKLARFLFMIVGFVLTLLLLVFAKPIAIATKYPNSYLAVLFLAPTIFFSSITASYRGYFQGRRNMTPTASSQVLEQIVNVIFTLSLAAYFMKVNVEAACAGGTFATTIAAIVAAIFLAYIFKREKEDRIIKFHNPEVRRLSNKRIVRRILKYTIPMTICAILQYTGVLVDLWNTKSRLIFSGMSEVNATILYGYLQKYQQLINVPITMIAQLSVTIIPAIAAANAVKDRKNVEDNINFAFKFCFMIAIPSAVGLSFLSRPVYRMLGYGGGSALLLYGSYIVILMAVMQTFSGILQGIGKLYIVIYFLTFGIIGKIITNYFLIAIPKLNIMGALIGNVVYYIIPVVLDNIVLIKVLKININIFKHGTKPLAASAVMGGIIYVLYFVMNKALSFMGKGYLAVAIPTIISIIIGMYIYFYVMVYIKGITKEDMEILPHKITKLLPKHLKNKLYAQ